MSDRLAGYSQTLTAMTQDPMAEMGTGNELLGRGEEYVRGMGQAIDLPVPEMRQILRTHGSSQVKPFQLRLQQIKHDLRVRRTTDADVQ